MQVVKNYLYNAFYQIFILIVPLVTTTYLARVIGPTGVGINSYTNSIIQYFILFGSMGVNLYGNRQIAFVRDNEEELTATFYEIFFMKLITVLIAYLAFLLFLWLIGSYRIYYLAQSVSLIAAAFDISWFFMGVENFGVTVFRNFLVKIVTLISIFTFVKSYSDLAVYILILSLSLLVGNLSLFPNLHRYIGKFNIQDLHPFKHALPALSLFIPQVATQIYLVVNKTMLGAMTSVVASGYFDQSDKIIKMVLAIVTATGTVMLPHVANAFMKGEKEKTKQYLYKSFSFVSMLAIPLMLGLIVIADEFVPLFFTNKFLEVSNLLKVEAIVIVLIAWSNAIGTQYLLPTNQTKDYTRSVVCGAVVNILANIPLIIMWGALGSAIATVLSELTVTIYQFLVVRNQLDFGKLFHDVQKYLVAGIAMVGGILVLIQRLPSSWLYLGIEILVGILIYFIFLIILRVDIFNSAKKILKKL
ncbi:flippase [Levilactobacillus bambusae]|uniref:Flippase n=1 Tax=Levilactobacillus bambusae TaxID=2024736 RepID=A0A2V1N036_9LACO|nr:flippase [Levilactobacillus bambusae]PWF99784.1 flippase [Levilactobacillus bambusae]